MPFNSRSIASGVKNTTFNWTNTTTASAEAAGLWWSFIAIDCNTSRRSHQAKGAKGPMVSALHQHQHFRQWIIHLAGLPMIRQAAE
jgi:hypothetical protein